MSKNYIKCSGVIWLNCFRELTPDNIEMHI